MRTKIYLTITIIIASLIGSLYIQTERLKTAKEERDIYENSKNTLLMDIAI